MADANWFNPNAGGPQVLDAQRGVQPGHQPQNMPSQSAPTQQVPPQAVQPQQAHVSQAQPQPIQNQDPAWHGQQPVTRREPPVTAPAGYRRPVASQPQAPAHPQAAPSQSHIQQAAPVVRAAVHPAHGGPAPQQPVSPQPPVQQPAFAPEAQAFTQAQPVQPQMPPAMPQPTTQQAPQPVPQPVPQSVAQPVQHGAGPKVVRRAPPEQAMAAAAGYAQQPAPQPQPAPQSLAGAEPDYPAYQAAPETAAASGFVNGLGALLSLALIGGLAVWGIKLAMRDVTDVPVVAAIDGPMRVQPTDPQGQAADHQGLAVNNVAADGATQATAPQVQLAPPAAELAATDTPAASAPAILAAPAADATLGTGPLDAAETDTITDPTVAEIVAQIAAEAEPLSGEQADLSMTPEAEARALAAATATIDGTVPGVIRSPRPKPRPVNVVARSDSRPASDALLAANTALSVPEVDAASIPVGTRLVQLGAYDSEAVARAEWDGLSRKFGDYLDGKSRVIEQAQSGGKTFYRLRAMGFDDLSDARRFCSALMAGKAPCIPVITR